MQPESVNMIWVPSVIYRKASRSRHTDQGCMVLLRICMTGRIQQSSQSRRPWSLGLYQAQGSKTCCPKATAGRGSSAVSASGWSLQSCPLILDYPSCSSHHPPLLVYIDGSRQLFSSALIYDALNLVYMKDIPKSIYLCPYCVRSTLRC